MEEMHIDLEGFVRRDKYLRFIAEFIDKPVIKVLVGMRRVGKSVLMKLIINDLLKKNIPLKNILYINKESLYFDNITDYNDLYDYAKSYFKGLKKKYIFVDEVQEIEGWEKAVASFMAEGGFDIYISGSNANMLSSELATLLSGRYIEVPVYPLKFSEFLQFREKYIDIDVEFRNYLKYGGLPGIHYLSFKDEVVFGFLNSILNTILYKDVISRNKIREVGKLDKIIKYLFDNIGNITTAKRIKDYFKSQGVTISVDTVVEYLKCLEASMLLDIVPRYDLKGKKVLEFYDKVFINDIGLRHGLIGYKERDINGILENIVYKELQSRGYEVNIGVFDNVEIDFCAEKQNEKMYVQVCLSLADENVIRREFGNLQKIKDNYEKIVVSMDRFFPEEIEGIRHRYLLDFLLDNK